jgi:mono/diheme cytochrome c family protein
MIGAMKAGLVIAATLAVAAIGAGLFIESGFYDIGADDHHTKIVLAIFEKLRERSIEVRSQSIEAHYVSDAARIAAGAQHYAAFCVDCHLAPGVTKSDIRPGLYPHPPNLAQQDVLPAQRAFWIIKHGIKMSAMPAWGKTLDDPAIWEIVAFVRKMPEMSAASYAELTQGH